MVKSGLLCNIIVKTRLKQTITFIIKLITTTFYTDISLVKPNAIRVIIGLPVTVTFTCQSYNKVEWFRLESNQFLFETKSIEVDTSLLKSHRSYYCKTKTDDGFTVYGYGKLKVYSK